MTGVGAFKCPTCGKRRYLTRKEARQASRRWHRGDRLSPYRCGQFWHLGHLPKDIKQLGIDRSVLNPRKARP
jgi:predicted RNA-binding Zn-ribbon protein involved in translation (DUF1610 family)